MKVGAPIAILAGEGEEVSTAASSAPPPTAGEGKPSAAGQGEGAPKPDAPVSSAPPPKAPVETPPAPATPAAAPSPAAALSRERRGRKDQGLAAGAQARAGAGHRPQDHPGQRPGRAHRPRRPRQGCRRSRRARRAAAAAAPATHLVTPGPFEHEIPHEVVKLSNVRKTIARRLTESKQQIPHIYLTVDIHLDALLKLRSELNKGLESRNIKLSVNDLMIKALAMALIEVPECNVSFAGDTLVQIQPRRHFGRGVDPRRPDHPDRRRCRRQERLGDRHRDPRPRRARQGGQAPAPGISGRHREPRATWACTGSRISRR